MKKSRAILGGALAAMLLLSAGAQAHATPIMAATCVVNEQGHETLPLASIPINYFSDFDDFEEELDWYATDPLKEARAMATSELEGITPKPVRSLEFFSESDAEVAPTDKLFFDYAQVARNAAAKLAAGELEAAEAAKLVLEARYKYLRDYYNGFVQAFNADRLYEVYASTPGLSVSSLMDAVESAVSRLPELPGAESYQDLEHDYSVEEKAAAAHQKFVAQLVEAELPQAEAEKRSYSLLTGAIADWIERQDLDYLMAFEAQVRQYLATAQSMGLVIDSNTDRVRLDTGVGDSRPIAFADFFTDNDFFGLHEDFLRLALNEDQTDFLAPSEIYASEEFQYLVGQALGVLEGVDPADEAAVARAVDGAIYSQYSLLSTPGSSQQPVAVALPYFLAGTYFAAYVEELDAGRAHPMAPLDDWLVTGTLQDGTKIENELPYDVFRSRNYIDVPEVVASKTGEGGAVGRTISYEFVDGKKAADDKPQLSDPFSCVWNGVLDEFEWVDPSEPRVLPAVPHPTVTYPASNARVLEPEEHQAVNELAVALGDKDTAVTVTYPVEFGVTNTFEDEDGNEIAKPIEHWGRWSEGFTVAAPDIEGFTFVSVRAIGADGDPVGSASKRAATPPAAGGFAGAYGPEVAQLRFVYAVDAAWSGGSDSNSDSGSGADGSGSNGNGGSGANGAVDSDGLASTGGALPWLGGFVALLAVAGGAALLLLRRRPNGVRPLIAGVSRVDRQERGEEPTS